MPTSVNYTLTSQWDNANRAVAHSIYVQDQWTRGRMTLQGALRYDRVDELGAGGGNGTDQTTRFSPAPVRFGRHGQRDRASTISLRAWVLAYDLFGNGRTALKASAGKYLSAATADGIYSSQNQGLNYVRSVEPCLDRLERQLRRRLRSAESGRAEHQRHRRRRLRGADRRQPELRQPRSEYHQSRSRHPERLGRPAVQLELRRVRAARAASRRLGRRRLQPSPLGQLLRHLQRARRRRRLRRVDCAGPESPDLPNSGGTESFVAITPAASARGSRSFMTKEENVAGEARTAYWHGVDVNAHRAAGGA